MYLEEIMDIRPQGRRPTAHLGVGRVTGSTNNNGNVKLEIWSEVEMGQHLYQKESHGRRILLKNSKKLSPRLTFLQR